MMHYYNFLQAAIKAHLCEWFDKATNNNRGEDLFRHHNVCIVGTSNRPDDIDPCLRRGGRFECEIDAIGRKEDRAR